MVKRINTSNQGPVTEDLVHLKENFMKTLSTDILTDDLCTQNTPPVFSFLPEDSCRQLGVDVLC